MKPSALRASLLPKSVTTPIAVPLSVRLRGIPSITVAAILAGVVTAIALSAWNVR
jgi:putative effector of murein hydrolase